MSSRPHLALGNTLKQKTASLAAVFVALALLLMGSESAQHQATAPNRPRPSRSRTQIQQTQNQPAGCCCQAQVSGAHCRHPPQPSYGQIAGLHVGHDALDLKSSVALVDQDTREVLFSKNDQAVLPIASLTKLMTGLVISEARLPMNEVIAISQADVDTEKVADRA